MKSLNPSNARRAWEHLYDLRGRESEQTMTLRIATCEALRLVQCDDVNMWRMQPANGHHTAGGHGFAFPTPGWRSEWYLVLAQDHCVNSMQAMVETTLPKTARGTHCECMSDWSNMR
jgi:hypothetical protein